MATMQDIFGAAWEDPETRDAILVDYLTNAVLLPEEAMQRPDTNVRKFVKVTGEEAALRLTQAIANGWKICGLLSPASIKHCQWVLISLREFQMPHPLPDYPGETMLRRVLAYKIYTPTQSSEYASKKAAGTLVTGTIA